MRIDLTVQRFWPHTGIMRTNVHLEIDEADLNPEELKKLIINSLEATESEH